MSSPFVLVSAIGFSNIDTSIALKFAPQYPIAFLCDAQHSLDHTVNVPQNSGAVIEFFKTDLSVNDSFQSSINAVTDRFGKRCAAAVFQLHNEPNTLPFLEQTSVDIRKGAVLPIAGAYAFAQQTIPLLLKHADGSGHPPTLLFVGTLANSFSDEIKDNALTALSRSLGREFGKKGIHVCHVKFKKGPGESLNVPTPKFIAETYWHLHTQPLSCFNNEITI